MKTTKKYTNENPLYEHYADDPFYLFFSKESFLYDEPHYHESMEIIYLLRGKATVYLSGYTRDLEAGDIFICNKKLMHFYNNQTTDTLALCLVLSNKYTHDLRELHKNALFPSFLTNHEHNEQIYQLLQTWFDYKGRTFLVDCAFANLLFDKIIKLYGFASAQGYDSINKKAIELINYILENYNQNISLESAAKYFGYSKEYFSKFFKQTVGKNFLDFLNATRTQKALEMLNETENRKSVHEICIACGFNNPTSLYRHLKTSSIPAVDKTQNGFEEIVNNKATMCLRDFTEADFEKLYDFMAPIWEETYGDFLQAQQIKLLLDKYFSKDGLQHYRNLNYQYRLIDDVGVLVFVEKEDYVYIDKLYLSPAARGKQYPAFVFNELLRLGKDLVLNVNQKNARAVKCYLKNGFVIERTEDIYLGDGMINCDYIMRKHSH